MAQVRINLEPAKAKLSQAKINRGRYAMANQAIMDMNPFVPMREGILRMESHISSDGSSIIYSSPYAARMFYMYMRNYTTPGTGPRWDIKAKRMFMSSWIDAFVKGADW
ncbi:minor capsid protein [Planomicrobium sp. YIM 101495]|uniref:minor capsid protein n=1 Tax=Planomicrobium sp. YIM 101495 TaxID=2665160 RepID=UPI0012B9EACC|nr:minor capsid protein [Planomicrobium sp. YIM 101495]MTD30161.1 capsid protein [Planomicrobium sp. YIM 101495]